MRTGLKKSLFHTLGTRLFCMADIKGSEKYPDIHGAVWIYPYFQGSLVIAEIAGLPTEKDSCNGRIFGFHIHEGTACTGNAKDPFANAGGHFNPDQCQHPEHAGDLPPLFESQGYAFCMFYTNRFVPEQIEGKTIIIHDMPDDFHSQPSGNSGEKIACGTILCSSHR